MATGIGVGIAGKVFDDDCCGGSAGVTTYNCNQTPGQQCVAVAGPGGTYSTLAACNLACQVATWDCTPQGCVQNGAGTGVYYSLADCDLNCACEDLYSCLFVAGAAGGQWLNNNTSPLTIGLAAGTGDFTIAFWVKFTNVTAGLEKGIISWGAGNDPKMQIYLLSNGSGIQFNMSNLNGGGNTWNDGTGIINPPVNTWIHYAYTADRTTDPVDMTGTWYQNGIDIGSKSGPFPVATNDMQFPAGDNLYFGRRQSLPNTQGLEGNLDDFTVWNKCLTSTEILAVMGITLGAESCMTSLTFYNFLTHWWEMGDNFTPPGPATYPTIFDSKGSIDLTMVQMAGANIVLDTPP